jgi:hypothetical protein
MRFFLLTASFGLVFLFVCVGVASPQGASLGAGPQAVTPLMHGHAHNDYEHNRPLSEAIENGFCSIEADVFADRGKLFVTHDAKHLDNDRTLQSLYLDPLRRRIKDNGGRVYAGGPTVILLIDLLEAAKGRWSRSA